MKGLIIKKEWLDKIFAHGKKWEMRSRPTKFRGKILLIESGSGMIVGEAHLVDCKGPVVGLIEQLISFNYHQVKDSSLLEKWRYPWVLSDAKRYPEPIPYKHPKGAVVWVNIDQG